MNDDQGARLSGRTIQGFRLGDLLGRGGMGLVYRAVEVSTGRDVAFKVLLRHECSTEEATNAARRLRDEASATAKVRHPGLVELVATGEDSLAGVFVVYEYVPGTNLRVLLQDHGPMSQEDTLELVARPLLKGLAELHRRGVIHRDVKPENMFRRDDGIFALGDLGLAFFEDREAKTRTGVIVGTPGYLAPEHLLEANRPPTPATDVYAAAAVIVETLTGAGPYEVSDARKLVYAQVGQKVTAARLQRLGVPGNWSGPLEEALQRDVTKRTPDPSSLLAALDEGHKRQQSNSLPATSPRQAIGTGKPTRVLALFAALCCIGVVVFQLLGQPKTAALPDIDWQVGPERIDVEFDGDQTVAFILCTAEGSVLRRGRSAPLSAKRQQISVQRLTPATSFIVKLAFAARERELSFTTDPVTMTAPLWVLARAPHLYVDVRTNLRSTPIDIHLNGEAKPRGTLRSGTGSIIVDGVHVDADFTEWQLWLRGVPIAKGIVSTARAFYPKSLFPGPRVVLPALGWSQRRLLVANHQSGLAIAVQNHHARNHEAFLSLLRLIPTRYSSTVLRLLPFADTTGAITVVSQEVKNIVTIRANERYEVPFPGTHVLSSSVGHHRGHVILLSHTPEGLTVIVLDISTGTLVARQQFDDRAAVAARVQECLARDRPLTRMPDMRYQGDQHVGPPVVVDGRLHSIVSYPVAGQPFPVALYYSAPIDDDGALGTIQLHDAFPVAALTQAVVPEVPGLCFSTVFGVKRRQSPTGGFVPVHTFDSGTLLVSRIVKANDRFHCIVYRRRGRPSPLMSTVQSYDAHLLSWQQHERVQISNTPLFKDSVFGVDIPSVRHLYVWRDRYLVGASWYRLFAIDLESGHCGCEIYVKEKVRNMAISPDGLIVLYRGDIQLELTSVPLLLKSKDFATQ